MANSRNGVFVTTDDLTLDVFDELAAELDDAVESFRSAGESFRSAGE